LPASHTHVAVLRLDHWQSTGAKGEFAMPKHKILVIDDEKPTLSMFMLFLKAYGYEVLLAENGTQGLKLFEAESPAIVFTDIKMPGMDGFEVLDRIKGQSPKTEVIVITGHGDMELAVEALNHEATDFINKPIHRSALDAALQRAEERIKTAKTDASITGNVQGNNIRTIKINGNVNAASEKELMAAYQAVDTPQHAKILLRFHDNASINGAGIGVLIQLLSDSIKKQHKIAITGVSENFEQIFKMVGITRLVNIFPGEKEAIAYLDAE
jgi:anti-anti-sigma factor